MNDSDVFASPTHKEDLLNTLAHRAAELGYSHASLEDVCGLAQGHVGKLFGPSRSKGCGLDTLYLLLPALGLKFALVVDVDALQRYAQRGLKRNGNQARVANFAQRQVSKRLITRVQRYFGALGLAAQKKNRKGAGEANKQPPASGKGRRGARQQNGNGTASAYDAPIGDELEQIAAASSIQVSREAGEKRGAKRGRVSAPFPSPMDQRAIRRRTQARLLSMHGKPITVAR